MVVEALGAVPGVTRAVVDALVALTSADITPARAMPVVAVVTSYSGAGAREVESLVTRPIEQAMGYVGGVESVSSETVAPFSPTTEIVTRPLATLTAVRPPARFGHLELDGDRVTQFDEKPQTAEGWINGAFFVLEPQVFDYIEDDDTQWEKEPLERLAADGQLMAYRHDAFWQCMDTIRDKKRLEKLWQDGNPPWKMWD